VRIIALMNQKGGVGKTTTTVNLGAALAELGKQVCLVDLDPQSHLTINYGLEPQADVVSLYDVLVNERSFAEAIHMVAGGEDRSRPQLDRPCRGGARPGQHARARNAAENAVWRRLLPNTISSCSIARRGLDC